MLTENLKKDKINEKICLVILQQQWWYNRLIKQISNIITAYTYDEVC